MKLSWKYYKFKKVKAEALQKMSCHFKEKGNTQTRSDNKI